MYHADGALYYSQDPSKHSVISPFLPKPRFKVIHYSLHVLRTGLQKLFRLKSVSALETMLGIFYLPEWSACQTANVIWSCSCHRRKEILTVQAIFSSSQAGVLSTLSEIVPFMGTSFWETATSLLEEAILCRKS